MLRNLISFALIAIVSFSVLYMVSDDSEYQRTANALYTELFANGEVTEKSQELYEELTEYQRFENRELHRSIIGMYNALDNDRDATPYQLDTMRLLNE